MQVALQVNCKGCASVCVKGDGKGLMGFSRVGPSQQLELSPYLSWGRQDRCEHPPSHLLPSNPGAGLSPDFGPRAFVGPGMQRGGHPGGHIHCATYVTSYLCTDTYIDKA